MFSLVKLELFQQNKKYNPFARILIDSAEKLVSVHASDQFTLLLSFFFGQFERHEPVDGKITERDFAGILVAYAGFPDSKRLRMLKRVKKAYKEEPQVRTARLGAPWVGQVLSHGITGPFLTLSTLAPYLFTVYTPWAIS